MKRLIFGSILFVLLPISSVGQQPSMRPDFEIAREAVERGEILPLATVIQRVLQAHPGQIIEVELEYSTDGRKYEIEMITTGGRLIEVDVDAVTGKILDVDELDEDDDD